MTDQEIKDRISKGNELPFEEHTEDDARDAHEQDKVDALTVQSTAAVKLLHYAQLFEIKTLADSQMAANELISIGTCKRAMEALRTAELKPHRDAQDAIRANYTDLMAPVLEAESIMKGKQLAYLHEQQRIQAEQEAINRKRREAAEAEMRLEGAISEPLTEITVAEAPKRVHGAIGTTGMVDSWKYEATDFAALPDEYKVVDTAMLNAIARKHHDQKQVPGVRFYNEPYLASRGR